ncbi:MAG: proton-translocating transhydrogenase family protein [Alphaproteobacteria bacterium]|nr:proton-translocating transhydrogenase family protein [Alphaproteobacteria bacterium]
MQGEHVVAAIAARMDKSIILARWLGFFAIVLAAVNIFGGFLVTQRMLSMYRKKDK